jgi:hypothetical protein
VYYNEGAQYAAYLTSILFSVNVDVLTLASIVYLISKEFSKASKLDNKGSLSARDKEELIVIP